MGFFGNSKVQVTGIGEVEVDNRTMKAAKLTPGRTYTPEQLSQATGGRVSIGSSARGYNGEEDE